MNRSDAESDMLSRFSERYRNIMSPVSLDIEEETLGTRCGASSWSTPAQVEEMAAATALSDGQTLLDIGSGAGWPGVRIGELTGAAVTLSDVTWEGLVFARSTYQDIHAVETDSAHLPFADHSFDAITHSDVLCCLPAKLESLRECHRVLSDEGVMVFTVIAAGDDLDAEARLELSKSGSEFLVSDEPYPVLLEQAGFAAAVTDVTSEFRDLARRVHRARQSRLDDLVDLWGDEDANDMVDRAAYNEAAASRGEMVRLQVVARPV